VELEQAIASASRPDDLAIQRVNRLIMEEMETEHYFTLLLAVADLKTGNVQMAQAWHPHPLVQRSGGSVDQSGPGGLPVGLIEGANYRQFEISLYPGDRILILSDGVTECPDPAGVLLGEDGLEDAMKRLKDVKGEALLEALIWELTAFSEGKEFPDDVSGILLEFNH